MGGGQTLGERTSAGGVGWTRSHHATACPGWLGAVDCESCGIRAKPLWASKSSQQLCSVVVDAFVDLELVKRRFKRGRPGGLLLATITTRAGSRCIVSRSQVRPFQMSRTAFALTPNSRATLQGLMFWPLFRAWLESLIENISTACSTVRIALVLQAWIEDKSCCSWSRREIFRSSVFKVQSSASVLKPMHCSSQSK